jgi:hypothetical protein
MIDFELLEAWLAQEDDTDEVSEFLRLTQVQIELAYAVHGEKLTTLMVQHLVEELQYATHYSDIPFEDTEVGIYLESGDPLGALGELLTEPGLSVLNTHFADMLHCLRCYVLTGMFQDAKVEGLLNTRAALEDLVAWGSGICLRVPVQLAAMPKFRILSSAAEARQTLDLGYAVDMAEFAALASFFRDGTPDQIRKTLQNQVAARQLEVDEHRRLVPASAMQFLRGTGHFPSLWLLPEKSVGGDLEVKAPVFVPVCPPLFGRKDCPFLPDERHDDGYHVGAGDYARVFADYWEALEWLTKCPEPAFRPRGAPGPMRCKPTWLRVSGSGLNAMLT